MDNYPHNIQQRQRGPAPDSQLFEDTSTQQQGYPGGYAHPGAQQPQGAPGNFVPGNFVPGAPGGINMLNEPMANMAFQYGTSLAGQGKEMLEKNMDKYISASALKYYFAVDTSYVGRKLGLLLWPFSHKDWSIQYQQNVPVAPRFDLNAPDLYIPIMAFVTFILMNGLALGMADRFTPEELGMRASSALVWLTIEVVIILFSLYLVNAKTDLKTFDIIAYSGYKYVGMNLVMACGLFFNPTFYSVALAYTSFTIGYFLLKTLRLKILSSTDNYGSGSTGMYLTFIVAIAQSFFLFWLTKDASHFFST